MNTYYIYIARKKCRYLREKYDYSLIHSLNDDTFHTAAAVVRRKTHILRAE